jgi:hypothetical protein
MAATSSTGPASREVPVSTIAYAAARDMMRYGVATK